MKLLNFEILLPKSQKAKKPKSQKAKKPKKEKIIGLYRCEIAKIDEIHGTTQLQ